ncbi:hypothetical protein [Streptomyces dysideae]|uniref:Uncharacterized protein n=1 Tax=Streptomyces dysideae TaxID=909626 RepID=A0A101UPJ0_9ACTN|nr:hypothetical protein [Streptomyces dysideae]KUO14536.1 hypothetical protein AQJ91_46285 [Streptomyces dysideae]
MALMVALGVWLGLAGMWPYVTFHLAPGVVTLAWAVVERLLGARPLPRRRAALLFGAGAAVSGAGTALLAAAGHLAGPVLVGANATAEAVWVILTSMILGWAGVTLGRRR